MIPDDQLRDLKDRNPCYEVAGKWVTLRKSGDKWTGPCPLCSESTTKKSTKFVATIDRWMCAACMDGGDVIELVRKHEHKDFQGAVEWLGGVQAVDPAERAKRDAAAKQKKDKADRVAAEFRERERGNLHAIYKERASEAAGDPVEVYLAQRGLAGVPRHRLRCLAEMPYWDSGKKDSALLGRWPAMLAPIMKAGKFAGLHVTYLDAANANGKAKIPDPEGGDDFPAKKMRGSKGGGFIPLAEFPDKAVRPRRLFIGEGIETVLSVYDALQSLGLLRDGDIFWAAGDLGNIGGKSLESVRHPTLKDKRGAARPVPGPLADLAAPGIAIPESIEEVVILGDGDSDPFTTRCAIARGCTRFAAPGRVVRAAFAPDGQDFNDMWRAARDAAAIVAIIDAAGPITPADIDALQAAPARDSAPVARPDNGAAKGGDISPLSASVPAATAASKPRDPPGSSAAAASPSPSRRRRAVGASENSGKPSRSGASGRKGADRGSWGGGDGFDVASLDRTLAYYPLTDLGNAERFVQRNKQYLRYCPALGWLYWSGTHWAPDSAGSRDGAGVRVKKAEHLTVRGIQDEAEAIRRSSELNFSVGKVKRKGIEVEQFFADLLSEWGRASEENRRLTPIHKRAEADLHVDSSELDSDPFTFNCRNGTLVIRRKWSDSDVDRNGWEKINDHIYFKPHDPADLITKVSPVVFDREATAPEYVKFLKRVQPIEENRRHLHMCGGLALTGDISEQVMWFFWGRGKNGKSTLLNAWAYVAGGYSKSVSIETFLDQGKGRGRSGGQATPDLAALAGVRLVRTSEPEEGAKLAEALIKLATGGEPMSVRHLNMPFFEMTPLFKLLMSGNYRPKIRGTDEGIWRRMRLVPWIVTIPEGERDPDFGLKLEREASGILNHLLAGLCDWLQNRLNMPKDVADATAEYRKDSDVLGRFLESCVETKDKDRVQSSALYAVFQAWCKANGEREWTATGFGRALGERGFHRIHSDVNWWLNIRLIRQVSDFVDGQGNARTGAAAGGASAAGGGGDATRPAPAAPTRHGPGDGSRDDGMDDEIPF